MARVKYNKPFFKERFGKQVFVFNNKSYTKVPYDYAVKLFERSDFDVVFEKWEDVPEVKVVEKKVETVKAVKKPVKKKKLFRKRKA